MRHRLLVVCLCLALAVAATSCQEPLEVTGSATHPARTKLPPGAVLEVQLADVTRADAPAVILDKRTYTSLVGPPYPFVLRPRSRNLNPRGIYAVQARILVAGKLFMVNKRRARIDNANPLKPIEVRLERVPTTLD